MSARFADAPPELAELIAGADHVDVKQVRARTSLRGFLAAFISYHPRWLDWLYVLRAGLVRLLGMRQEHMDMAPLEEKDVDLTPGGKLSFFTTELSREDRLWVGVAEDKHLAARVVVERRPGDHGAAVFLVSTVVHYKHWTGPVYFNLIRPFHHLVVHGMCRSVERAFP
ncbi:DUF2867 domain-containing protein [Desulfovibrio aminophilus]|nr:DUF2867 domain-containing protein [Desulfovibrio aminophilus]MCM0756248.1 DUF2867 domain-containing protein [Desulfovibrio aminophilus]